MIYNNHEKKEGLRLVNDIYTAQDDDIGFGCDAAAVDMERCADELLSDSESQAQFPKLWRHFRFCQDCAVEYQMLMDIAQLEAAGGLVQPKYIPPMPTKEPIGFSEWFRNAKEAMTTLFSGFTMPQPSALRRSSSLIFEPVEVEFDKGNFIITFDVEPNSAEPQLRELHCWLETEDEALEEMFEFAPAWLQQGADGPVIQEQTLNELGDLTFSLLPPGNYTFRLYLAGQEYVVKELVLS